jgi:hypothetical protein
LKATLTPALALQGATLFGVALLNKAVINGRSANWVGF